MNTNNDENNQIFVTKPYLPPLSDVVEILEGIWERRILTNCGPLHDELEERLCSYLGVEHISLFANGTLALLVALKSLRLQGEVITTPFSFVATSEALTWNGLEPVFADIKEDNYGLCPASIEASITPRTTAILPVHCYGFPCDIKEIQQIADDYNLKVIVDAAHAFGVECDCGTLLQHGDLCVLSFHATKIFNTFEGGAVISPDAKTKKRLDRLKNFGFVDEVTVAANGINAKMSELHAAIGLAQLPYMHTILKERKRVANSYSNLLKDIPGIILPSFAQVTRPNYSYYPIRITDKAKISRNDLTRRLNSHGILPRRYFYPLISDFQFYRSSARADRNKYPIAAKLSQEVLCLPIYPELSNSQIDRICNQILHALEC